VPGIARFGFPHPAHAVLGLIASRQTIGPLGGPVVSPGIFTGTHPRLRRIGAAV